MERALSRVALHYTTVALEAWTGEPDQPAPSECWEEHDETRLRLERDGHADPEDMHRGVERFTAQIWPATLPDPTTRGGRRRTHLRRRSVNSSART
ncbi:hypothetical protein [Amycolatopsis sp. WGS_07]|uniref:hypothetical protein n=1 Tax=Amycolatopsis sp. WGS_07 TaxID=3076764 RepID=UPI00387303E5